MRWGGCCDEYFLAVSSIVGCVVTTGHQVGPLTLAPWVMLVVLAFIFACLLDHTVKLRRQITPKLEIDFDAGSQVQTTLNIFDDSGRPAGETKAIYLRCVVTCAGELAAKDCEPLLTNVERQEGGVWRPVGFHDSLDLAWSNRGERGFLPLSIAIGARRYFDILFTRQDLNRLHPAMPWPNSLKGLFDDPATLRFEVGVLCEGVTKKIAIIVIWNGKWNEVKAHKDPSYTAV
jgi:hypothetical protein